MEICTLASGSSGNCTLVQTAFGTILIDAGISCKRICDGLKARQIDPAVLDGILITHEHADHIAGLKVLLKKYRLPIYTSAPTGEQLTDRIENIDTLIHPVKAGVSFTVGGLEILPFQTPHDAAGSLGFTFSDGKCRGALATDMGRVTDEIVGAIRGAEFVLLETNYEEDWLMDGPYPYYLKQRILGDNGHLSNADGGAFACYLAETGTKTLVLGHLSKENNTPEQASRVVRSLMNEKGIHPGADVRVEVAPRSVSGPVFQV
ncbi:MAG: MBL fold metallo-hydrolase [Oscillospiraceae bacterium]|nr:MBL fold metallo-hydrolase [Oscillospiraceae bacterium]